MYYILYMYLDICVSTYTRYMYIHMYTVYIHVHVAVYLLVSQAVWRGHVVRRQQSSRAVQRARQRVRQANASAQRALSIQHRLPSILECLKSCKYLTSLANQLHTLGIFCTIETGM